MVLIILYFCSGIYLIDDQSPSCALSHIRHNIFAYADGCQLESFQGTIHEVSHGSRFLFGESSTYYTLYQSDSCIHHYEPKVFVQFDRYEDGGVVRLNTLLLCPDEFKVYFFLSSFPDQPLIVGSVLAYIR